MEPDKLITEARARIIWGEPSSSVRDYLIANGISGTEADAKLKEFNLERNREIRRLGIKNTLIGAVLTGIAGGLIYYLLFMRPNIGSLNVNSAKGLGGLVLLGFYGLWKLVNGIIYLVRPQSEHQSIPDIDE